MEKTASTTGSLGLGVRHEQIQNSAKLNPLQRVPDVKYISGSSGIAREASTPTINHAIIEKRNSAMNRDQFAEEKVAPSPVPDRPVVRPTNSYSLVDRTVASVPAGDPRVLVAVKPIVNPVPWGEAKENSNSTRDLPVSVVVKSVITSNPAPVADARVGSRPAVPDLPALVGVKPTISPISAPAADAKVSPSPVPDLPALVGIKPTISPNPDPIVEGKVSSGPVPAPPGVRPVIALNRASISMQGDKQLTGMRPIVPLQKRGQSFRETKKMITTVDADGRRHLNQYTFMEQLGKGAYGVVFKVECNDTKEIFAAKCVDKKALKRVRVGRFGNALQSVKKELNIWKRFKHRHIVILREVIDTDDSDELVMISELVEGGPVLDDDIECTPLNAELTRAYFTHLIEGIDFLHQNKIIHRDIKPGNLLLKTIGENEVILKIADFGVSHEMANDNEDMRQTAGTAIFMAPEMLTGENFQGKPVDIWACGVTLYMFIYGRPPFVAKTMTELYAKIRNDPILYAESVGDRVVENELIELLQHLLDKDPKQRFTSQQIRAHPWAWREFQVSAIKCVTHPNGRRTTYSDMPMSLAGIASLNKSMRSLFSRPSPVFPGSARASLPAVMASLEAPQ